MPIGQNQGIYITDQNGQIIIDKLPMGSYLISEVKTLPGNVFDDTVYEVAFNKEDRVTKEYQYTLNVENKLTQTTISKIDALTKQLLPGATLELYLKDGESLSLIEQWVSTDDAHLIKGLLVDCEYVLKEVKAPAGYTLAPELTFKVENSEKMCIRDRYKRDSLVKGVAKAYFSLALITSSSVYKVAAYSFK